LPARAQGIGVTALLPARRSQDRLRDAGHIVVAGLWERPGHELRAGRDFAGLPGEKPAVVRGWQGDARRQWGIFARLEEMHERVFTGLHHAVEYPGHDPTRGTVAQLTLWGQCDRHPLLIKVREHVMHGHMAILLS